MGSFSGQVIHTHTEHRTGAVGREGLVPETQSSLVNINSPLSRFRYSLLLESFRFEDENEYEDLT